MPQAGIGGDARVELGGSHEVLVLPHVGVVRAARTVYAAAQMPRNLRLLDTLRNLGLPFAVPRPLSDAVELNGRTVSAVSWIAGSPLPRGAGAPDGLGGILAALRAVDLHLLRPDLNVPHAYAGGAHWAHVMLSRVIPLLPRDVCADGRRRVEAAISLDPVEPTLVHGDLAGANLLWHDDGSLSGVVDWELASAGDPAIDAACLAWFGWPNVRAITDDGTFRRAGVWFETFGLEQLAAAVLHERPPDQLAVAAERAAAWLRSDRSIASRDSR